MAPAKKKSQHYKSLPPHSNEAHPLARMGEVNKTLVISIVVILALVVLVLFLFVAKPFAGKAIALPPGMLNPLSLGSVPLPSPGGYHALSGEDFSFQISANLAEQDGTNHETVAISFQVALPNGVSCPTIENLLPWNAGNGLVTEEGDIRCENGQIYFTAATINPFDAQTNLFPIANLHFAGLPEGQYAFSMHEVTFIDLATGQPLVLEMLNPTIIVQSFECTGLIPPVGELCHGDNQDLSADTPLRLVAQCTNAQQCEYTCALPLIFENGACIAPTFQCTGEQPANTRICDNDAADLTQNTALQVVASCTDVVKCELVCDPGTHFENGACVANACTGTEPANAVLCDGDNAQLPADTLRTTTNACTDAVKCEYTCNPGFTLQNGACVQEQQQEFQCLGTAPANAQLCSQDEALGLNVDTPLHLVAECTDVQQCEYICNVGFTLQNGVCVPPAMQSAIGTKITVEEITPADNLYQTKITATEDITAPFTVVTQLFTLDRQNRERSAVVEVRTLDPLARDEVKIIATKSLGETIVKKRVVVYDTPDPSKWTVHLNDGTFDVAYSLIPPLN